MDNEAGEKLVKELEEIQETLKTNNSKVKIVTTAIYWLIAGSLIILKAMGLSTLSWFWTLIMLLWPFYMLVGVLVIALCCFIGAVLIMGGLELYDYYDNKKINERREKGLDE